MAVTKIEKENLEAHVELCAERYKTMMEKLDVTGHKVTALEIVIGELRDMLGDMANSRNNQIIKYAGTTIGTLLAIIGYFIVKFVINS